MFIWTLFSLDWKLFEELVWFRNVLFTVEFIIYNFPWCVDILTHSNVKDNFMIIELSDDIIVFLSSERSTTNFLENEMFLIKLKDAVM